MLLFLFVFLKMNGIIVISLVIRAILICLFRTFDPLLPREAVSPAGQPALESRFQFWTLLPIFRPDPFFWAQVFVFLC